MQQTTRSTQQLPEITTGGRKWPAHLARNLLLAILLLSAIIGGGLWWRSRHAVSPESRYRTVAASYGDITQTVTANGTLNPVVLVNVGTQVSGTVQKLYVDFNDHVKAGQMLAQLDPSLLQAQLNQDIGSLQDAQSSLALATSNERRMRQLVGLEYITRQDYDTAVQALHSARAKVAAAQALVNKDRTNLNNSVIRSPVSGVVVSRDVDVGQTVAASFQTPTLFKIARDLRDMQIDTSVAEADVGNIKVGQPVSFTVDAFPNRTFEGRVKQIRLNATIQQNVVTYDVVVGVNNADLKLLPAMTAYINILVNQRNHVLMIPNAALRFRPQQAQARPGAAPGSRAGGPGAPGGAGFSRKKQQAPMTTVYVLRDEQMVPLKVGLGISDSRNTEVTGGSLKPGDKVIVEDTQAASKPSNTPRGPRIF